MNDGTFTLVIIGAVLVFATQEAYKRGMFFLFLLAGLLTLGCFGRIAANNMASGHRAYAYIVILGGIVWSAILVVAGRKRMSGG
jgi:hypothetical protein